MKTDNELIAEFMEFVRVDYDGVVGGRYAYSDVKEYVSDSRNKWLPHELIAFQTSWDWLMPVVEKIGTMENELDDFVEANISDLPIAQFSIFAEIKTVHKAVVEFIKWYNQQP